MKKIEQVFRITKQKGKSPIMRKDLQERLAIYVCKKKC